MNKIPSVTAIIPTIGRAELARALTSVRGQVGVDVEVVVVLDRPGKRAVVDSLLDGGERLVVTRGGEGGAVARNRGIDAASSDYVAFLDDDDWWESDKLQQQFEMFRASGGTVCFSAVNFHSGARTTVLPKEHFDPALRSIGSYLVRRPGLRHGHGYFQSSTILVRSDIAERVRWDPVLPKHQDWDFVVRLLADAAADLRFCGSPLTHVQKGSLSSVSKTRNWADSILWLEKHGRSLDKYAYGDFVWTQVLRSAIASRDLKGMSVGVSRLRDTRPSGASVLVGLSGAVEAVRSVWR